MINLFCIFYLCFIMSEELMKSKFVCRLCVRRPSVASIIFKPIAQVSFKHFLYVAPGHTSGRFYFIFLLFYFILFLFLRKKMLSVFQDFFLRFC